MSESFSVPYATILQQVTATVSTDWLKIRRESQLAKVGKMLPNLFFRRRHSAFGYHKIPNISIKLIKVP